MAGQTYYLMGNFHKSLGLGLKIIRLDSSRLERQTLAWFSYYCLGDRKAAAAQLKILEAAPRMTGQIAQLKAGPKSRCGDAESR